MTGSAGYITVTIGPPDPAQLSAHPLYIRFACAHTDARRRENFVFLKTILDQVQTLHAVAKGENRATFGADEILAREYGLEVPIVVRSMNIRPVRTSFQSPWQNGIAERWVESCRRDLLDHIIAVNERHLKRLVSEYVRYYHEDRTHLGLGKATPHRRTRSVTSGHIISLERLGGLHHRYDRAA